MATPNLEELESRFRVLGRFRERDGPASEKGTAYCNKKLCIVATDKHYLVRMLAELSEREDCFYVKYATEPRDGMYLGRVFLLDAREVAAVWRKLKRDDKVLCSVQDDDFINPLRDL